MPQDPLIDLLNSLPDRICYLCCHFHRLIISLARQIDQYFRFLQNLKLVEHIFERLVFDNFVMSILLAPRGSDVHILQDQ